MPKPRKTRKAAMPTGNSTRHKSQGGWLPSNRGKTIIAMVVLALATAAAYSNSLSATFVFDDRPHIFANERIKTVFPLSTTLSGRRPVVDFTLAVNHAIGGFDPAGYHLFNVVVHILQPEAREYYDLEHLYAECPTVDWRAIPIPPLPEATERAPGGA